VRETRQSDIVGYDDSLCDRRRSAPSPGLTKQFATIVLQQRAGVCLALAYRNGIDEYLPSGRTLVFKGGAACLGGEFAAKELRGSDALATG